MERRKVDTVEMAGIVVGVPPALAQVASAWAVEEWDVRRGGAAWDREETHSRDGGGVEGREPQFAW